jgi:hypothetical protein|eukprot:gene17695-23285_t
MRKL